MTDRKTEGEKREGFKKFKDMELPRNVVVGNEAIEQVGKTCDKLELKKEALIVCDPNTKKVAGERVADTLSEHDYEISIEEISGANQEEVDKISEKVGDETGFLLGVGGGRSIDVAKYSSHLAGIPFVSIPTAASHDGIASGRASIERNGSKVSVAAQSPLAMIADTGIIAEAPDRLLAAGCGDIIANATAVKDWELAKRLRNDEFSHYAANLSEMTSELLLKNIDNIKPGLEESAWQVVKALVSSSVAMSIAGSSRPASGSEHKFSHSLDEIAEEPALHGEQCGVGTIIMKYLQGGDWKKIKNSLEAVDAPSTARGLEVTEEEVIEALIHAPEIRPERYTILGSTKMNREAAEEAAKETGVI
ncbi:MAG: NAD(P)-dependent glycerol-1-phosphate dehydrogenase [Candidatus Thermoplasmatota archaeon]|nr:NAD(P)-dependent glycerol-1-phosphate dehydrogenase [Candidatus Thermoplasmatota archaeon]